MKRAYSTPVVRTEKVELGVFGCYGWSGGGDGGSSWGGYSKKRWRRWFSYFWKRWYS